MRHPFNACNNWNVSEINHLVFSHREATCTNLYQNDETCFPLVWKYNRLWNNSTNVDTFLRYQWSYENYWDISVIILLDSSIKYYTLTCTWFIKAYSTLHGRTFTTLTPKLWSWIRTDSKSCLVTYFTCSLRWTEVPGRPVCPHAMYRGLKQETECTHLVSSDDCLRLKEGTSLFLF